MAETLSKKDRMILINQYLILEKLYPAEAKEYAARREAIESGYTRNYFPDGLESEMSIDSCREVVDILQMFRVLQGEYGKLTDKSGIVLTDLKFKGFDGNNESTYYAYTQYLIETQGLFQESEALNSHAEKLNGYRNMLATWNALPNKHELTNADIRKIVASR